MQRKHEENQRKYKGFPKGNKGTPKEMQRKTTEIQRFIRGTEGQDETVKMKQRCFIHLINQFPADPAEIKQYKVSETGNSCHFN